jgi:hypothetical protein
MAFNNSYGVLFARTIDVLTCSWIWRDYDITISSMTGLELRKPSPALWARILGWCLNHIEPHHCELAIAADIERATNALLILRGKIGP